MENTEFNALKTDIEKSLKTIEQDGAGTKTALKKLEDGLQALNKELDTRRLEQKAHPLFGNYRNAEDFLNVLRSAAANSRFGTQIPKDSPLHISKADLNSYGSGTGVEVVPTATSNVMSMLLTQGGVARQECTVLTGLTDKVVLPKRNGTSTAAFTNASSTLKDDVAVTAVAPGTASVTLSPSQIVALAKVSEKLLYMSAVNIAEFIAMDMIEQASVLEDNCVVKGDGTVTYGSITGVQAASGVVESTVAFGSFDLSDVIKLPGTVAEAAQTSPDAKFYMSGKVLSILRAQKSSGTGQFYMDPTTGTMKLAGYDVKVWHRLDNTIATNKFPVYFGDFKKAVILGIGRDMSIVVDHSYAFNQVQAAFRLAYDFDAQFIQPTALARLKTLIS